MKVDGIEGCQKRLGKTRADANLRSSGPLARADGEEVPTLCVKIICLRGLACVYVWVRNMKLEACKDHTLL